MKPKKLNNNKIDTMFLFGNFVETAEFSVPDTE